MDLQVFHDNTVFHNLSFVSHVTRPGMQLLKIDMITVQEITTVSRLLQLLIHFSTILMHKNSIEV